VPRCADISRTSQELSRAVFWLGIFLDQDFVNCTSGTLPTVTQFGANLVIGCGPGEAFKHLGRRRSRRLNSNDDAIIEVTHDFNDLGGGGGAQGSAHLK